MIDPQLENKVILISGANHGIGAATARAFAAQGARVCITYYREPTYYSADELAAAEEAGVGGDALYRANQQRSGEALADEINRAGGRAAAREADLAEAANIPRLFDWCEALFGPVEVLVNNHTYCILETFDPARVTERESGVSLVSAPVIDAHFVVNARAYALMISEYVQRYLKRQGQEGRIINISTDAAHAHDSNVSYAASKHAIESYSRSAAAELGHYGITVNIVAPGPTQTGYIPPALAREITPQIPLRRLGRPDDVADVILFLASAQARWLTGQLIYAGGGWRMAQ